MTDQERVTETLTEAQRKLLTAPDSRMQAYHFGFERTGVEAVDAILSALAWAGKATHSTEYWSDTEDRGGYGPFVEGQSYAETIQAAANEAAERLRAAKAESERVRTEGPCHHQNTAYLRMMRERDEARAELAVVKQQRSDNLREITARDAVIAEVRLALEGESIALGASEINLYRSQRDAARRAISTYWERGT